MRIRKAKLSPMILKMIDLYREKNLTEIRKIKSRWACGVNKKYLYNITLRPSRSYRVFYIELKKLIDSADFGEMTYTKLNPQQLFSGIDESDFRIAKILDHWSKDGYIDPPEICINHLQKISFGDGRHRTIVAFHLGQKEIPVIVHMSLIEKISTIINLSKVKSDLDR